MATTEVASASLGPQYAPDDPTLVKPWKGLIDGSTGVLYYWNPESNVTQYEKPPNMDPISPSFTPKLAPLPVARSVSQQQKDVQPWGQYATHPAQGTQPQHPIPVQQQSFQNDVQQFPSLQGRRFPSQQVQQMQYQQPNSMQAQRFPPPEGHKIGSEYQMGKDYRAAQPQQPAISSHQSHQHGPDSNLRHQIGGPMGQNQQHGGSSVRPNVGQEEDLSGRAGNGFYFNNNKEGPGIIPQQPKLAAMPMPHIQQGMRIPQGITPSHTGAPNFVSGHTRAQTYDNTTAAQMFTKYAPSLPPSGGHESSTVTDLSSAEAYCREHEVTVTGDNVPAPFMTFEATGFPTEILREIQVAGFSSPTPIQAQTWPIAMQRKDIVAIAKTGSGKTLGYIIPAFLHLRISRNASQNGPTVLILAPTRELATQIQDEVIKFGRSSRISCTCLYGGAPKGPQLKELERGADIVVATPGRLNDILEMNKIDFRQVSFLVLDEADRMLDMGFEPQIRTIVNRIPPHRQTLMYTATWPNEVKKIAGDLLVNPVQVNIGSVDVLAANKAITQHVEIVPQMNKQRRLEQILRGQERGSRAIIFCSTKRLCDQLARSIGRNFGAAAIHGDKSQSERDWVLNQFRSGKSPVLVATDVAARGLDVKDIRVVINYDFPTGIEDYVHRIGRTGRAGAGGVAYTFLSDQDRKHAADLVKVLVGANQVVPPEVQEMAGRGGSSFGKFRGGISRWNTGGHSDSGGRGGMRANGFDAHSGGRDGGFGGRGSGQDVSFGGRGGRANFGGRGNQGQRFSGSGSGSVGWGRHDGSPHSRYDQDGPRQHQNGRGGGRISRGSYSRSPDMVRTWDTRSSSRSSSRSRSRSRSRSPRRSNFTRSPERRSERDHLKTESVAHHKPPAGTQGDDGSPALELPLHQGSPAGTKPDLQPVAEV